MRSQFCRWLRYYTFQKWTLQKCRFQKWYWTNLNEFSSQDGWLRCHSDTNGFKLYIQLSTRSHLWSEAHSHKQCCKPKGFLVYTKCTSKLPQIGLSFKKQQIGWLDNFTTPIRRHLFLFVESRYPPIWINCDLLKNGLETNWWEMSTPKNFTLLNLSNSLQI